MSYDPYSGKWKREGAYGVPPPRRLNECGWCLILILLALSVILGASVALYFFPVDRVTSVPSPEVVQVIESSPLPTDTALPPSSTPTPRPQATHTSTPTARPLFESPTPLDTQTPTDTPKPSQTSLPTQSAGERFDFFARAADFPKSVDLQDVSCTANSSHFTLVLNHPVDELVYLEIILQVEGDEAVFSQIIPNIPKGAKVQTGLIIALNGDDAQETALFNLTVPLEGETFANGFEALQEELKPQDITQFSMTWLETEAQPPIFFEVRANHPNGGGVEFQILWARQAQTPLDENERLKFQIC